MRGDCTRAAFHAFIHTEILFAQAASETENKHPNTQPSRTGKPTKEDVSFKAGKGSGSGSGSGSSAGVNGRLLSHQMLASGPIELLREAGNGKNAASNPTDPLVWVSDGDDQEGGPQKNREPALPVLSGAGENEHEAGARYSDNLSLLTSPERSPTLPDRQATRQRQPAHGPPAVSVVDASRDLSELHLLSERKEQRRQGLRSPSRGHASARRQAHAAKTGAAAWAARLAQEKNTLLQFKSFLGAQKATVRLLHQGLAEDQVGAKDDQLLILMRPRRE